VHLDRLEARPEQVAAVGLAIAAVNGGPPSRLLARHSRRRPERHCNYGQQFSDYDGAAAERPEDEP